MFTTDARCSDCGVTFDASRQRLERCPYCKRSLVGDASPIAPAVVPTPVEAPAHRIAGSASVTLTRCGPNKILVIKVIREHVGCGLKEAKDLSENTPCMLVRDVAATWAERFRAALLEAGAEVESDESTAVAEAPTAGIFLESCGPNKILIIKTVREHTGLGLKESMDVVQQAPCAIEPAWSLDAGRLQRFRDALIAAGASVR